MPPSLPAMLDRREPGEEPAAEGGGMKSRLARKFGENRGKTLGQTADLCAPSRQTREGCSADQAFANPVPLREREALVAKHTHENWYIATEFADMHA